MSENNDSVFCDSNPVNINDLYEIKEVLGR